MEVCNIHQNITAITSVALYLGHATRRVLDAVSLVVVVNEWRQRDGIKV